MLSWHCENEELENCGTFRELVSIPADVKVVLQEYLQNTAVFKGTSETYKTIFLDSTLAVFKEEIYNQIIFYFFNYCNFLQFLCYSM